MVMAYNKVVAPAAPAAAADAGHSTTTRRLSASTTSLRFMQRRVADVDDASTANANANANASVSSTSTTSHSTPQISQTVTQHRNSKTIQSPRPVFVAGRRSFGGFNPIVDRLVQESKYFAEHGVHREAEVPNSTPAADNGFKLPEYANVSADPTSLVKPKRSFSENQQPGKQNLKKLRSSKKKQYSEAD